MHLVMACVGCSFDSFSVFLLSSIFILFYFIPTVWVDRYGVCVCVCVCARVHVRICLSFCIFVSTVLFKQHMSRHTDVQACTH